MTRIEQITEYNRQATRIAEADPINYHHDAEYRAIIDARSKLLNNQPREDMYDNN